MTGDGGVGGRAEPEIQSPPESLRLDQLPKEGLEGTQHEAHSHWEGRKARFPFPRLPLTKHRQMSSMFSATHSKRLEGSPWGLNKRAEYLS